MQRSVVFGGLAALLAATPAAAQSNLGGGLIEFLVRGGTISEPSQAPAYAPPIYGQPQGGPAYVAPARGYAPSQRISAGPNGEQLYLQPEDRPAVVLAPVPNGPTYAPPPQPPSYPVQQAMLPASAARAIDPRFLPQEVDYAGPEAPGTIVINTPERYLYLVLGNGRARRYGIGVGRPGFAWAGEHRVTAKKEWPDWTPPAEMLQRQPYLPRHMPGGPNNPLGARAMYLGSTLYRIHGSNEPWTIGHAVSSGCIRMRNEDVIDLYNRVQVGTKVIVI